MTDGPILAFDTSAAHSAAAIVSGERVLACRIEPMTRGQAERLMPLLTEILAETGLGIPDIAAFGTGIGPGNFTGIRIAVSAARGLTLATGRPAVGVSGLEAAAFGLPRPILAAIAAPRARVYLQGFGTEDWAAPALVDPAETSVPGLPVTGSGAAALAECGAGPVLAPAYDLPLAVARLAAARLATSPPRPAPLYLRPADASPPADMRPRLVP